MCSSDLKEFKPDFKQKKQLWFGNFYAAQTYDNAGEKALVDGPTPGLPLFPRRVQIGWVNGGRFPEMPFNQQMTVPVEKAGPALLKLAELMSSPAVRNLPKELTTAMGSLGEITRRLGPLGQLAEMAGGMFGMRPSTPAPEPTPTAEVAPTPKKPAAKKSTGKPAPKR